MSERQPLVERGRYLDVANVDAKLVKGTAIKKSTRPLLEMGENGKLVDWPATNDKYNESYRKWLNHPLSKGFDSMFFHFAEHCRIADTASKTAEPPTKKI